MVENGAVNAANTGSLKLGALILDFHKTGASLQSPGTDGMSFEDLLCALLGNVKPESAIQDAVSEDETGFETSGDKTEETHDKPDFTECRALGVWQNALTDLPLQSSSVSGLSQRDKIRVESQKLSPPNYFTVPGAVAGAAPAVSRQNSDGTRPDRSFETAMNAAGRLADESANQTAQRTAAADLQMTSLDGSGLETAQTAEGFSAEVLLRSSAADVKAGANEVAAVHVSTESLLRMSAVPRSAARADETFAVQKQMSAEAYPAEKAQRGAREFLTGIALRSPKAEAAVREADAYIVPSAERMHRMSKAANSAAGENEIPAGVQKQMGAEAFAAETARRGAGEFLTATRQSSEDNAKAGVLDTDAAYNSSKAEKVPENLKVPPGSAARAEEFSAGVQKSGASSQEKFLMQAARSADAKAEAKAAGASGNPQKAESFQELGRAVNPERAFERAQADGIPAKEPEAARENPAKIGAARGPDSGREVEFENTARARPDEKNVLGNTASDAKALRIGTEAGIAAEKEADAPANRSGDAKKQSANESSAADGTHGSRINTPAASDPQIKPEQSAKADTAFGGALSHAEVKWQDIKGQFFGKFVSLANAEKGGEITVILYPENLGKLSLKVKKDDDGITAQIITSRLEVMDEISRQSTSIVEALKDQGIKLNSFDVSCRHETSESSFDANLSDLARRQNEANRQARHTQMRYYREEEIEKAFLKVGCPESGIDYLA